VRAQNLLNPRSRVQRLGNAAGFSEDTRKSKSRMRSISPLRVSASPRVRIYSKAISEIRSMIFEMSSKKSLLLLMVRVGVPNSGEPTDHEGADK